jgi:hypothetical protein
MSKHKFCWKVGKTSVCKHLKYWKTLYINEVLPLPYVFEWFGIFREGSQLLRIWKWLKISWTGGQRLLNNPKIVGALAAIQPENDSSDSSWKFWIEEIFVKFVPHDVIWFHRRKWQCDEDQPSTLFSQEFREGLNCQCRCCFFGSLQGLFCTTFINVWKVGYIQGDCCENNKTIFFWFYVCARNINPGSVLFDHILWYWQGQQPYQRQRKNGTCCLCKLKVNIAGIHIHIYIHTCMCACIHTYIHTYLHTHTHAHARTYVCTYIHTHT